VLLNITVSRRPSGDKDIWWRTVDEATVLLKKKKKKKCLFHLMLHIYNTINTGRYFRQLFCDFELLFVQGAL
jgi:hypothetical protein